MSIDQEIIALENRYWQAIQDKNSAIAMSLTDETCIVTGPRGIAKFDHDAFQKMMQESEDGYVLKKFKLSDMNVMKLSDDVAVVAYNAKGDYWIDGKPVRLDASEASTWVRRNGRWFCAMHAESLKGDPYGRDRMNH